MLCRSRAPFVFAPLSLAWCWAHSRHLIIVCGSELNYLLMALGWTRPREVLPALRAMGLICTYRCDGNCPWHCRGQRVFKALVLSLALTSQGCGDKAVKLLVSVPGAVSSADQPLSCVFQKQRIRTC